MKKHFVIFLMVFGFVVASASADSWEYGTVASSSKAPKAIKKQKRAATSEDRLSRDDAEFAADYKKRVAKEGYVADRDCSCRGSAYCSCAPSSGGYGYWDGGYGYGYGYGYGSGFGAASGPWSSGW